jgi:hypothetical protein
VRRPEKDEGNGASEGYTLEEVESRVRLLKRPGGFALAAFVKVLNPENIQHVAEADKAYLGAKEWESRFGMGADSESAFMFTRDVKEARERYLLALEAAYRE